LLPVPVVAAAAAGLGIIHRQMENLPHTPHPHLFQAAAVMERMIQMTAVEVVVEVAVADLVGLKVVDPIREPMLERMAAVLAKV
jgi:NADH:ubiquinone oxidoreductase subunit D